MFDNPQPCGPRVEVGKSWIFMSFSLRGTFLVGLNFNCACVEDVCPMTPRTRFKDCRFNWFCSMSKISKGGSQMRNFTIFLRT